MKKILPLALVLIATSSVLGQLKELPIHNDTVASRILNEKRALEIVLPSDFDAKSDKKYEVFYVTDGEWNTRIASDIHQFLEFQFLPPCIIVSIPNVYIDKVNQRDRDLTPTHADGSPHSGGAPKYLAFIKNELIPYINKTYPTNGTNILYGSSLGGLFGLYVFLTEPQLFESYMLADPAFWWDHGYIRNLLSTKLDSIKTLNKSLLIAGRVGKPYDYMGISSIDSVLRNKKPDGLRWTTKLYEDETHNSMVFMTMYAGLKHTYSGFTKDNIHFFPANGIVVKGKPVKIRINAEEIKDMGYTLDGSDPVPSSSKVTDGIISFSEPAQLTIKAYCNIDRFSKKAIGSFKAGTPQPPSPKLKKAKAGGLHYSYYEGSWDKLPDFKKLKAVQTGFAGKEFGIGKLPHQSNMAMVQEGQLEAKSDGYYLFALDCNGGARLFIGNQIVIDYDGLHSTGNYQSFILPLTKGFYPFRLEYFTKDGGASLELAWATPENENPDLIPSEAEYGY